MFAIEGQALTRNVTEVLYSSQFTECGWSPISVSGTPFDEGEKGRIWNLRVKEIKRLVTLSHLRCGTSDGDLKVSWKRSTHL